jgi:hypothetical protein
MLYWTHSLSNCNYTNHLSLKYDVYEYFIVEVYMCSHEKEFINIFIYSYITLHLITTVTPFIVIKNQGSQIT